MKAIRFVKAVLIRGGVKVGFLASMAVGFTTLAASAAPLHHSETFLDSLYVMSRIQAPRLGLAASQTFIAHPSLLQRWRLVGSDAAAMYNDWTNTLLLQPEMTIFDSEFGKVRVRSLPELHAIHPTAAIVQASVAFHELSHAEWDLYVEEGAEDYDQDLVIALRAETPAMARAAQLSALEARTLPSEIFAYYREDLVGLIFQDTSEIKLASGLDPVTNACRPLRQRPEDLRDFSPSNALYEIRAYQKYVFVDGKDVFLDHDHAANLRVNAALARHARATLRFPASRADLLERLRKDPKIRAAIAYCRNPNAPAAK